MVYFGQEEKTRRFFFECVPEPKAHTQKGVFNRLMGV
jgi:hypothetical protein